MTDKDNNDIQNDAKKLREMKKKWHNNEMAIEQGYLSISENIKISVDLKEQTLKEKNALAIEVCCWLIS